MAKDFIGYQALADSALRGVVREALRRVEKQGLVGAHHFRITFKTGFPGVEIPDFLREQYPEEMMIILQHQFWGLKVKDNHFEVTLSFKKVPATLSIPFAALTQFADPGVAFGLQFREVGEDGELKPLSTPAPTPLTPPMKSEQPSAPAESGEEKPPAAPGEVVSLDAFRKK
ncbi:MAG: hypothetical protein JSR55_05600 [Proteobacteria bacterium]|nr:hypothetical protein [Pseudomonadota bacterium]